MGIAVDLKTNRWIETGSLSDDELDAALGDDPGPWFLLVLLMIVTTCAYLFYKL